MHGPDGRRCVHDGRARRLGVAPVLATLYWAIMPAAEIRNCRREGDE
jgi:hypothetical protein